MTDVEDVIEALKKLQVEIAEYEDLLVGLCYRLALPRTATYAMVQIEVERRVNTASQCAERERLAKLSHLEFRQQLAEVLMCKGKDSPAELLEQAKEMMAARTPAAPAAPTCENPTAPITRQELLALATLLINTVAQKVVIK